MNTINKIFSKLMEWASEFFNYFGIDGLLHIFLCYLATSILDIFLPLWLAIIIVAVLGLAKELIYDLYLKKGDCSKKDLMADLIGIILGCI